MIFHLLPRTRRIKNCAVDAANSRKCLLNNLSENRALIFFLSGSVVCCTVKVQKAFGKDAGEAENRPRGVAILLFLRERKKQEKSCLRKTSNTQKRVLTVKRRAKSSEKKEMIAPKMNFFLVLFYGPRLRYNIEELRAGLLERRGGSMK